METLRLFVAQDSIESVNPAFGGRFLRPGLRPAGRLSVVSRWTDRRSSPNRRRPRRRRGDASAFTTDPQQQRRCLRRRRRWA